MINPSFHLGYDRVQSKLIFLPGDVAAAPHSPARRVKASESRGHPGHNLVTARAPFSSAHCHLVDVATRLLPQCQSWPVVRKTLVPMFALFSSNSVRPDDDSDEKYHIPTVVNAAQHYAPKIRIVHRTQNIPLHSPEQVVSSTFQLDNITTSAYISPSKCYRATNWDHSRKVHPSSRYQQRLITCPPYTSTKHRRDYTKEGDYVCQQVNQTKKYSPSTKTQTQDVCVSASMPVWKIILVCIRYR